MSIGPLGGILGSAAGAPRAQANGNELDRMEQDSAAQQRQVQTDQQAELAAGVGQTSEEGATSERDADGRRLWETPPEGPARDEAETSADETPSSRDPDGTRGQKLDLSA